MTSNFGVKPCFLSSLRISRSAARLSRHQHVEDLALVVDGTPQIHPLAGDPHHHFVDWGLEISASPCMGRGALRAVINLELERQREQDSNG